MESIVNTSRVSIITKSEIRYEGTLFKINPEVFFLKLGKEYHPSVCEIVRYGRPKTWKRNPGIQPDLRTNCVQRDRHQRFDDSWFKEWDSHS